jgi:hypothetical protein
MAPHMVLFWIQFNDCDLLKITLLTIKDYDKLRKRNGSDGIIPQLIDNYLEKMKLLYPSMTRTKIFSDNAGNALAFGYIRKEIKKYLQCRFEIGWRNFKEAYKSEQLFEFLSDDVPSSLSTNTQGISH